jgi:hypothetical protein
VLPRLSNISLGTIKFTEGQQKEKEKRKSKIEMDNGENIN